MGITRRIRTVCDRFLHGLNETVYPKRHRCRLVKIFRKGVCQLSKHAIEPHAIEPVDCHLGARFPTAFLSCPTARVCDGKGKVC